MHKPNLLEDKPTINADENVWGIKLNKIIDKLQAFVNSILDVVTGKLDKGNVSNAFSTAERIEQKIKEKLDKNVYDNFKEEIDKHTLEYKAFKKEFVDGNYLKFNTTKNLEDKEGIVKDIVIENITINKINGEPYTKGNDISEEDIKKIGDKLYEPKIEKKSGFNLDISSDIISNAENVIASTKLVNQTKIELNNKIDNINIEDKIKDKVDKIQINNIVKDLKLEDEKLKYKQYDGTTDIDKEIQLPKGGGNQNYNLIDTSKEENNTKFIVPKYTALVVDLYNLKVYPIDTKLPPMLCQGENKRYFYLNTISQNKDVYIIDADRKDLLEKITKNIDFKNKNYVPIILDIVDNYQPVWVDTLKNRINNISSIDADITPKGRKVIGILEKILDDRFKVYTFEYSLHYYSKGGNTVPNVIYNKIKDFYEDKQFIGELSLPSNATEDINVTKVINTSNIYSIHNDNSIYVIGYDETIFIGKLIEPKEYNYVPLSKYLGYYTVEDSINNLAQELESVNAVDRNLKFLTLGFPLRYKKNINTLEDIIKHLENTSGVYSLSEGNLYSNKITVGKYVYGYVLSNIENEYKDSNTHLDAYPTIDIPLIYDKENYRIRMFIGGITQQPKYITSCIDYYLLDKKLYKELQYDINKCVLILGISHGEGNYTPMMSSLMRPTQLNENIANLYGASENKITLIGLKAHHTLMSEDINEDVITYANVASIHKQPTNMDFYTYLFEELHTISISNMSNIVLEGNKSYRDIFSKVFGYIVPTKGKYYYIPYEEFIVEQFYNSYLDKEYFITSMNIFNKNSIKNGIIGLDISNINTHDPNDKFFLKRIPTYDSSTKTLRIYDTKTLQMVDIKLP